MIIVLTTNKGHTISVNAREVTRDGQVFLELEKTLFGTIYITKKSATMAAESILECLRGK